jgi:hypothetical protein
VTGGDNVTSGDDQQETARITLEPAWIVGFTDGEGCFSVSLHRNERYARRSFGWQIIPTFHLYQHEDHADVLEAVRRYFGVGRIVPKGPNSSVLTYSVQRRLDVAEVIIPFFERHRLLVKDRDFRVFAEIVAGLFRGEHFTVDGFERLVRLAYSMNEHGKQRARKIEEILNGSSETARQA